MLGQSNSGLLQQSAMVEASHNLDEGWRSAKTIRMDVLAAKQAEPAIPPHANVLT